MSSAFLRDPKIMNTTFPKNQETDEIQPNVKDVKAFIPYFRINDPTNDSKRLILRFHQSSREEDGIVVRAYFLVFQVSFYFLDFIQL